MFPTKKPFKIKKSNFGTNLIQNTKCKFEGKAATVISVVSIQFTRTSTVES